MQKFVWIGTAEEVADLLDVVAADGVRIAAEADRTDGREGTVSVGMVEWWNRLADMSGAEARSMLAGVGTDQLLAGATVWLARRRWTRPPRRASERAAERWRVGR